MAFNNLIRDLVTDIEFYQHWFSQATDTQKNMFWDEVWNQSAKTHSDNTFIQGLYDFYQMRGYLSHKQFGFLIKNVYPQIAQTQNLKDRLK